MIGWMVVTVSDVSEVVSVKFKSSAFVRCPEQSALNSSALYSTLSVHKVIYTLTVMKTSSERLVVMETMVLRREFS